VTDQRPFGLGVLGRPGEPGHVLRARVQTLLTLAVVSANVIGALVVVALGLWIVPGRGLDDSERHGLLMILVPAYIVVAVVVGVVWGTRRELPRLRWAGQPDAPTDDEQRAVLQTPARLVTVQAALWAIAAALFSAFAVPDGSRVVLRTGATVVLGGAVTCAFAYLLSELALRPIAALALQRPLPSDVRAHGLVGRTMLGWTAGTAVPLLGLVIVAGLVLFEGGVSAAVFARTVLGLSALTLLVGLLLLGLATRTVVDPLRALRRALLRVEQGDLSTRTVVYDGSEIGQLQAAFNQMAAGLEERDRIRDLFTRHVGDEVARAALARGAALGGERCDATALFVDIVGSTTLTEQLRPEQVVAVLNEFFAHVVSAVDAEGGWVNKFEGDAALCVFGPPNGLADHATAGLRAARDLCQRLDGLGGSTGITAGIGVASGVVVAGNVGAEDRFEYTVIGDPVNVAARLTELAKDSAARIAAADSTMERSDLDERPHWRKDREVTLRGRSAPTAIYVPS
jgi:adenylate cyclase